MELKLVLEALLFSSQKPLNPEELRALLTAAADEAEDPAPRAFKKTPLDLIQAALEQLAAEAEAAGRSYRLVCVAGAWQYVTRPEYAAWLRALLGVKTRPPRLSQPALETLAIIAYRQPLTRAEIEQIRGVSVDGVMQTLVERGLAEVTGRAEVIGRPQMYGTTALFLEYFGLRSLADLPAADELRRLPLLKPTTLLTAEPGLATVPPGDLASPAATQGTLPLEAAPLPPAAPPAEAPAANPTPEGRP